MRLRLAGIVAAVLALAPLVATADDREDALKLARRIASIGPSGAVVTLHAPPSGVPSSIPLPAATLLGSVAHEAPRTSVSSGTSVMTTFSSGRPLALYYIAPNRDATVKAYQDALQAAGWKHVDVTERFPFPRGGFATPLPSYDLWCSPGASPSVVTIGTPATDATALDVNIVAPGRGTGMECGDKPFSPFQDFMRRSPLPTFTASPGVVIENSSNLGGDGSTSGARITSSLGVGPVFESFAKQLRAAGWVPKANSSAAGLQSQTFTKTVDGTPYVTLLTIYALDPTHYVALADASNLKE